MLKMTLMLLSNVKDRRWPYECNVLKINKEKRQDPFPWQGHHCKLSSTATVTQLHSPMLGIAKNLTWGGNVQSKDSNWCVSSRTEEDVLWETASESETWAWLQMEFTSSAGTPSWAVQCRL